MLEYKYIFDYYNEPLFFVLAGDNKPDQAYIAIDNATWFTCELDEKLESQLFTLTIKNFWHKVEEKGKLQVARVEDKELRTYSINDYYKMDPNVFNYLPKVDEKVDYEYLTNTKIDT